MQNENLKKSSEGRIIIELFSDLEGGTYALSEDSKTKGTKIYIFVQSNGTDFFRPLKNIDFPFAWIKSKNLLPSSHVPLNASPTTSDSQEYLNALIFKI